MSENKSTNIEELDESMRILFSKIPQEQWRFYHKKSVENFIYYLPKIKGRTEKEEIVTAIDNYFRVVEAGFGEEIDMSLGKELFESYLYPVARKFEWRLGFIYVATVRGLFFFVPLVFFFLWFLYLISSYVFYTAAGFLVIYLIIVLFKIKQRKVYGLGY